MGNFYFRPLSPMRCTACCKIIDKIHWMVQGGSTELGNFRDVGQGLVIQFPGPSQSKKQKGRWVNVLFGARRWALDGGFFPQLEGILTGREKKKIKGDSSPKTNEQNKRIEICGGGGGPVEWRIKLLGAYTISLILPLSSSV